MLANMSLCFIFASSFLAWLPFGPKQASRLLVDYDRLGYFG
jgi:hypothetical protein